MVAIKQLSFVWFYKIPIEFSDHRQIGLIHGLYKVLTKILSNRLEHVRHDLFLMIANKMVHDLQISKGQGTIFKVDFHKAFDSVSWNYLDKIIGLWVWGLIREV